HFNPAGVVEIDPATVVSSAKAERYQVLPGHAGLAQLFASGAIERMEGHGDFFIAKPIPRYPAGLSGGMRFVLGKGIPVPAGSPDSCVVSEETGEEIGNRGLCHFR